MIDGNVSSIDMTAYFSTWGGQNYIGGNAYFNTDSATSIGDILNGATAPVTNLTMSNCVAGVSCNWAMSWQSYIIGGPFNGVRGTLMLSGTITAVPESSINGMLLAGLGLIGVVARRRKRARPESASGTDFKI